MSDLICRNTMTRCQTPGTCSPHGGCQPETQTETVSSTWLAQLRSEFLEVTRQRDLLAKAIAEAGVEAGHVEQGHLLSGPQLLLILADMTTMLHEGKQDTLRYRWMRNCPWVGHMQEVGIMARGDDANWLSGADADRAIDAAMAPPPPSDEIPDFGGGGGNKARHRAAALGVDMDASLKLGRQVEALPPPPRPWKEIAEPVADADRQCHTPNCFNCEGTGRDPFDNGICDANDNFPF